MSQANPASIDIKDLLLSAQDNGDLEVTPTLVFAQNLFVAHEPPEPSPCVTIFDTPGRGRALLYDNDIKISYPTIQIRTKHVGYDSGWVLIHTITTFLHGQAGIIINGSNYLVVRCSSEPSFFDWDSKGRARHIANFEMQKRKV